MYNYGMMKPILVVGFGRGQFVLVSEIYKIKYHMNKYNDIEQTKTLFRDSGFTNIDLRTTGKHICAIGYK